MSPALPLDDAGPYVAAAYLVFLALVVIYVAIMATKLSRISREINELELAKCDFEHWAKHGPVGRGQ